jgi:hypothetical protein
MDQFTSNFTIHKKQTRQNTDIHLPSSKLTIYQKGTYYMAIKIYNSLPTQMKETVHDAIQFRNDLTSFPYSNSFYTLQEYFNRDN